MPRHPHHPSGDTDDPADLDYAHPVAVPRVGMIVHYMGAGSTECMAAIIARVCPVPDGVPNRSQCELRVFSPMSPNPSGVTAEYDPGRAGRTWHYMDHA